MMSQQQFLSHITMLLTRSQIPFMIAGSMGSSHYGEPRSTNDIDIVVEPSEKAIRDFASNLGQSIYMSLPAALDAVKNRSMFNVIDTTSGWKADLIVRKDREFSIEEFNRRAEVELLGVAVYLATPEDIVLSKLEWAKRSESERQIRDAASVLRTVGDGIDVAYLRKWAKELNVESLLNDILPE
jgi:hypothetical protein